MRFLVDQDVYEVTTARLRASGHDVLTAEAAGLSRAADGEILHMAHETGRILITRDKGFGQRVFQSGERHAGVILLRMEPGTMGAVHDEMRRFLDEHAGKELRACFVVIEPACHRVRKSVAP